MADKFNLNAEEIKETIDKTMKMAEESIDKVVEMAAEAADLGIKSGSKAMQDIMDSRTVQDIKESQIVKDIMGSKTVQDIRDLKDSKTVQDLKANMEASLEQAKASVEVMRKNAARRRALKGRVTVQYAGKEISTEELLERCKTIWVTELGNTKSSFKEAEVYVKPEENMAYYVINKEVTGSFPL